MTTALDRVRAVHLRVSAGRHTLLSVRMPVAETASNAQQSAQVHLECTPAQHQP